MTRPQGEGRGLQALRARGESDFAGRLRWLKDRQRLAVPGVSPRALEAVDVVRVAVGDADQLPCALDLKGDLHDCIGHSSTVAVNNLDEHMRQITAAGRQGADV